MDDESDLTEVEDTQNEWEYDEPEESRSRVRTVLVAIGNAALMLVSGFVIGACIGYILDAMNRRHS